VFPNVKWRLLKKPFFGNLIETLQNFSSMVSMKKRQKVTKKLALSGGKMKESRVGLAPLILVLFHLHGQR